MDSTVLDIAPEADKKLAEAARLLEEKEAENARLRRRIRLLEKALFGQRSERLVGDESGQSVFDELIAEVDELNRQLDRQEEEVEQRKKAIAPKTRKKRRNLQELIPEDLPREETVLDVPEEDKVCLETGEHMVRIGEERTEKLAYRPGTYFVKVFVRPKYASPKNPSRGIVCRPAPDFAIPGGTFDESFLAWIAVDKCAYHLPLYRLEEKLRAAGIGVSRQTLSRLYMQTGEALRPIYDLMKAEILARGIIFTDDTPVQLQEKGKGRTVTGRMWVYVGGGVGPPYRVFDFTRDRRKKRPKEFLGKYKGYIHADAYGGYDDLFIQDGVHECGCWMHVRRKFVEAEDAPAELRDCVLRTIRNIYRYERLARKHGEDLLMAVRREKIGPLIELLFGRTAAALKNGEVLPKSAFAAAIGYMQNLGDTLKTFLENPHLRPDNGESERALRPLAIGRKNWLFAGSKAGGDATGILLSLIQSCRVLDIDPFAYLEDVLRRINGYNSNRLQELLPGNWKPAQTYYA